MQVVPNMKNCKFVESFHILGLTLAVTAITVQTREAYGAAARTPSSTSPGWTMPRTCEGLFLAGPSGFAIGSSSKPLVPSIVGALQKSGITDVLNPKDCTAFIGACSLASVTVAVEVTEQLNGQGAASREILRSEAENMLRLAKSVTKRNEPGSSFYETLGMLRFSLAGRGQSSKTSVRFEDVDGQSDLALAPNEMMILGGDVMGANREYKHMILMFEQIGDMVRAVDPQTGKIEEYRISLTPYNRLRMVNLTTQVGPTSVMEVLGAIRITPEAPKELAPRPNDEPRLEIERLLKQMQGFRSVVQNFYELLPESKNSRFKTKDEARVAVKALLDNFNFVKQVLDGRPARIPDPNDAGLVFELQLTVADIQRQADENGFFEWLEHHGLTSSAKPTAVVAAPAWDAKMLEARVSPAFKTARGRAVEQLEVLMTKESLSSDDLNLGLGRLINNYVDLVVLAVSEVQPVDAHRLMTPYFIQLSALINLPQIDRARNSPGTPLFLEDNISKFKDLRAARVRLGVDKK